MLSAVSLAEARWNFSILMPCDVSPSHSWPTQLQTFSSSLSSTYPIVSRVSKGFLSAPDEMNSLTDMFSCGKGAYTEQSTMLGSELRKASGVSALLSPNDDISDTVSATHSGSQPSPLKD